MPLFGFILSSGDVDASPAMLMPLRRIVGGAAPGGRSGSALLPFSTAAAHGPAGSQSIRAITASLLQLVCKILSN